MIEVVKGIYDLNMPNEVLRREFERVYKFIKGSKIVEFDLESD